jgi:hypothetical protein
MATESELQAWLDRLAVQDLIHRYADSVTRADWDQTEGVFAPDAIVEISSPFDIRLEGSKRIREFLSDATRGSELLIQSAYSPVVHLLDANHARATATIHELSRGVTAVTTNFAEAGTAVNYEQYGLYYDEAAKIDGEWKFTHRLFQPLYQGPDVLTGTVIAARSRLAQPR